MDPFNVSVHCPGNNDTQYHHEYGHKYGLMGARPDRQHAAERANG